MTNPQQPNSDEFLFLGTAGDADHLRNTVFDKLTDQQNSYFWRPTEVDVTKDKDDFKRLIPQEQHIFLSNIKRQVILDKKQSIAPSMAFSPIASQPDVQDWITTWSYFETIHNASYKHIIKNSLTNPSEVLSTLYDIPEIAACANDISSEYDDLVMMNAIAKIHGTGYLDPRKYRMAILKALFAANILEGVRFYVSFACSWAFAEQKKAMEGNAKIIKLIARDENLHQAGTQHMNKRACAADPLMAEVRASDEFITSALGMFSRAVTQEKQWAEYLFKHGSMIGLNYDMLCAFIDYRANKCKHALGLPATPAGSDPLPWTKKWIAGSDVQVAPQEVEESRYTIGAVKMDVHAKSFNGLTL